MPYLWWHFPSFSLLIFFMLIFLSSRDFVGWVSHTNLPVSQTPSLYSWSCSGRFANGVCFSIDLKCWLSTQNGQWGRRTLAATLLWNIYYCMWIYVYYDDIIWCKSEMSCVAFYHSITGTVAKLFSCLTIVLSLLFRERGMKITCGSQFRTETMASCYRLSSCSKKVLNV